MKKLAATLFSGLIAASAALAEGNPPPGAFAEGEVRKVDRDAKKLTLRHGPISNLEMPAMTMVFRVKDPAMLEQVNPGDKVRFQADKVNGAYTVIQIETVN